MQRILTIKYTLEKYASARKKKYDKSCTWKGKMSVWEMGKKIGGEEKWSKTNCEWSVLTQAAFPILTKFHFIFTFTVTLFTFLEKKFVIP